MKFWQAISYTELDQLPELARHAEGLGFYGLTISDHLVTTDTLTTRYPYSEDGTIWWDPEALYPEPWTTATWLAGMTSTLRFMSYVYILALRDPFTVAKLLSTAACLSDNRIEFGVGVGWMREEFDLVGKSFTDRGKRVDEMLTVIRSLLTGTMQGFDGEYFAYPPVQMSPVPSRPVPVRIGGNTEAALRRAARNEGWLGIFIDPDELGQYLTRVNGYRAEMEATSGDFELLIVPAGEPTPDIYRRFRDIGVTAAVNPPWYYKLRPQTTLDEKKRDMDEFAKDFILPLAD